MYLIIRALSNLHGIKNRTINMFTPVTTNSKKLARWYRRWSWSPVVNIAAFVHCSKLLFMPVVTPDSGGLIPTKGTNIYLCFCVQTVSCFHSAFYRSIKVATAWSWPSSTSRPTHGTILPLPHTFLAWWLTEQSNSFSFTSVFHLYTWAW